MDRDLLKILLPLVAVGGVICPTVIRGLPLEAKAACLGSSLVAAATRYGLGLEEDRGGGLDQAIREAQAQDAEEALISNRVEVEAIRSIEDQRRLYEIAQGYPEPFRTAFLEQNDLLHLLPRPEPVAAPAPQAQKLGALPMPPGVAAQGLQATAHAAQAAGELDDSWFEPWCRRSGIVAGESGDGKTRLLVYRLWRYLADPANANAQVFIGDLDYGSSHDDAPPNLWLGLEVGRHIAIKLDQIYSMVLYVSGLVDRRASDTQDRVVARQAPVEYEPVLLIVDELPQLKKKLSEAQWTKFNAAVANILDRGLKQRVTFVIGSQSLASGETFPQATLRKIEVVLLHRAAQVRENYNNLGLSAAKIDAVVSLVEGLPRELGDKFVAVACVDKKPRVAGVPRIEPPEDIIPAEHPAGGWIADAEDTPPVVRSTRTIPDPEPTEEEVDAEIEARQDYYSSALAWVALNRIDLASLSYDQELRLAQYWQSMTGDSLTDAGRRGLIEFLQGLQKPPAIAI